MLLSEVAVEITYSEVAAEFCLRRCRRRQRRAVLLSEVAVEIT